MTEKQLLTAVRRLAECLGWEASHPHRSERSETGWPDLVLVHRDTGAVIWAELKSEKGRFRRGWGTPGHRGQQEWLAFLRRTHGLVQVWRPRHYLMRRGQYACGTIEMVLRKWAVRGATARGRRQ